MAKKKEPKPASVVEAPKIWTIELIQEAMKKGPVVIDDLPEAIYHSFPAMSASGLKDFKKTPGHWKYARTKERKETGGQRYGKIMHLGFNEPERFKKFVVVVEGNRNATAVKDAIKIQEDLGNIVCKQDEYDSIVRVVTYCKSHPIISKWFAAGVGERSFFWIDPATGAPCKARMDWITPEAEIIDPKTFANVHDEEAVELQTRRMFYHFQAWWYKECFFQVYGAKPKAFINLFLEDEPTNAVPYEIADQSLEECENIIRMYTAQFAECMKLDQWPMSPARVVDLVVKPFWS